MHIIIYLSSSPLKLKDKDQSKAKGNTSLQCTDAIDASLNQTQTTQTQIENQGPIESESKYIASIHQGHNNTLTRSTLKNHKMRKVQILGRHDNIMIAAVQKMTMLLLILLLFVQLFTKCHSLAQEHFSVAPMMAHTNRHYHTYFRFFSQHAHLYTEMIPAETIASLYNSNNKDIESNEALQELLGINSATKNNANTNMNGRGPIILQLGGGNPQSLALASEVGARMGYDGINLNCGCPSNAVSGRSGGCALMRNPSHVAECVERMSESIANVSSPGVELSVKHRLGVREASTYDAEHDKQQTDDEAYHECEAFIQTITENSNVQKLQVHARLGLLGDFTPDRTEALWTPNSSLEQRKRTGDDNDTVKIDHKREQYKAKKIARKATIHNRSVPPLRPNVVNRLAENNPHLDFVTNGGIKSMEGLRNQVDGTTNVMGAMVGRSVINHPCSFSHVDGLWGDALPQWTREDVILAHIQYCIEEEERCKDKSSGFRDGLRKKLVAVPFSLFAGEDGNDAYQRKIRKLGNRLGRHSAETVLLGALTHVSSEIRAKPITEFMPLDSIQYNQRCGPLQRAIL